MIAEARKPCVFSKPFGVVLAVFDDLKPFFFSQGNVCFSLGV